MRLQRQIPFDNETDHTPAYTTPRVLTLEISRLLNVPLMRSNVADNGQEEVMLVTSGLLLSEHGLEISKLVLRSCGPSHFIPHHRLASCYLCFHPKSARLLIYLIILISIYRFISRDKSACIWLFFCVPPSTTAFLIQYCNFIIQAASTVFRADLVG